MDKCLLCNLSQLFEIGEKDEYVIVKCLSCGFIFVNPRPTLKQVERLYNEDFAYNYEPRPLSPHESMGYSKYVVNYIRSYSPHAKTILDIGCSYAHTLWGLKNMGFDVFGTDLSINACEYAGKYYKINVFNQHFPPDNMLNSFDVIILSSVLEHTIDPILFMEIVLKYLKYGGILYIRVPNIDSISYKFFKLNWLMITPPQHLNYFAPQSISLFLNIFKLRLLNISTHYQIKDGGIWKSFLVSFLYFSHIKQNIKKRYLPKEVENIAACSTGLTINMPLFRFMNNIMKFASLGMTLFTYPLQIIIERLGMGEEIFIIASKNNK